VIHEVVVLEAGVRYRGQTWLLKWCVRDRSFSNHQLVI
jgi:hypothetical protein